MLRKINIISLLSICFLSTSLFAMKRAGGDIWSHAISIPQISIDDMPDEILWIILEYAILEDLAEDKKPVLELVCKKWNRLAKTAYPIDIGVCNCWNYIDIKKDLEKEIKNSRRLTIIYSESTDYQRKVYEDFINYINQSTTFSDELKGKFNRVFSTHGCAYDYLHENCGDCIGGVYLHFKSFFVRIIAMNVGDKKPLIDIYEEEIKAFLNDEIKDIDLKNQDQLDFMVTDWYEKARNRTKEILTRISNNPDSMNNLFSDPQSRPEELDADILFFHFAKQPLLQLTKKLLNSPHKLFELNIGFKGNNDDESIIPADIFASLEDQSFRKLKKLSLNIPTLTSDSFISAVKYFPNVVALDLSGSDVNGQILEVLPQLIHLKKLSLNIDCFLVSSNPIAVGILSPNLTVEQILSFDFLTPEKRKDLAKRELTRTKKLIIHIMISSQFRLLLIDAAENYQHQGKIKAFFIHQNVTRGLAYLKSIASLNLPDYAIEFYDEYNDMMIFPDLALLIDTNFNQAINDLLGLTPRKIVINLIDWPINKALEDYRVWLKNHYSENRGVGIEYINVGQKS